MDYSSNMNNNCRYGTCRRRSIIIIAIIRRQRSFVGDLKGRVVVEKALRDKTHMKNSGDDGLSLVDPASRNPFPAPEPVSFSHLSL